MVDRVSKKAETELALVLDGLLKQLLLASPSVIWITTFVLLHCADHHSSFKQQLTPSQDGPRAENQRLGSKQNIMGQQHPSTLHTSCLGIVVHLYPPFCRVSHPMF